MKPINHFKAWLASILIFVPGVCLAQALPTVSGTAIETPTTQAIDTASGLVQWVKSQQANIGLGLDWRGVKYVTTSWDLLSIGQAGLNVAKAGASDYLDLGPLTAGANAKKTRYGILPLVNWGNVWNAVSLPDNIQSHIGKTHLPDVAAGLAFFEPENGVLRDWQWKKDTQLVVVARFGGS